MGDDREDDAQPKSKKIKKDGKDKKEWFKVEDEVYIKVPIYFPINFECDF